MYKRKTKDIYVLMSNYGYGWEEEIAEETRHAIKARMAEYKENTNGSFFIKRKRVKL